MVEKAHIMALTEDKLKGKIKCLPTNSKHSQTIPTFSFSVSAITAESADYFIILG